MSVRLTLLPQLCVFLYRYRYLGNNPLAFSQVGSATIYLASSIAYHPNHNTNGSSPWTRFRALLPLPARTGGNRQWVKLELGHSP